MLKEDQGWMMTGQIVQFPTTKRKTPKEKSVEITNDIIYGIVETLIKNGLDPSSKNSVKDVCKIIHLLENVVERQLGIKEVQKEVK